MDLVLRLLRRVAVAGVVAALAVSGSEAGAIPVRGEGTAIHVTPTVQRLSVPRLRWKDCAPGSAAVLMGGFDCAGFDVPMDYRRPGGRRLTLAVVRHPAARSRPRGTIFFNPGGPGGTGTTQFPAWFGAFPERLRHDFDIVSWDPRGVGESNGVQCFASRQAELDAVGTDPFPTTPGGARGWIAAWRVAGAKCLHRDGALLRHVTTGETARDLDLLRRAVGERRLRFIGVSYGTYLAATYANMFPRKVGAMVLDGNVAPSAWTAEGRRNPRRSISLRVGSDVSSGRVVAAMIAGCGAAGPRHCEFATGSVSGTRAKFRRLLARLRAHPLTVQDGDSPIQLTYASLLGQISGGLYFTRAMPNRQVPAASISGWRELMSYLQRIWKALSTATPTPRAIPQVAPVPDTYAGPEQFAAVTCADAPAPHGPRRFLALRSGVRRTAGDIGLVALWGSDEPCTTWPVTSPAGYAGPWNHRVRAPLLLIGNSLGDPSTPYANTIRMQHELSGTTTRIVTLRGYGHTAFLNPSRCVKRIETRYFLRGTLPPDGHQCRPDHQPFDP